MGKQFAIEFQRFVQIVRGKVEKICGGEIMLLNRQDLYIGSYNIYIIRYIQFSKMCAVVKYIFFNYTETLNFYI